MSSTPFKMLRSRTTGNIFGPRNLTPSKGLLQRVFFLSSCAFLVVTSVAKIVSGLGSAPILRTVDPLFGYPFKYVMFFAAFFELAVAYLVFTSQKPSTKALAILMVSSSFAIYRFGLYFIGYIGLCPCMGNLVDAFRLDAVVIDTLLKLGLAYLICGSLLCLFFGDNSSA